jgi:hypothetical protein
MITLLITRQKLANKCNEPTHKTPSFKLEHLDHTHYTEYTKAYPGTSYDLV